MALNGFGYYWVSYRTVVVNRTTCSLNNLEI